MVHGCSRLLDDRTYPQSYVLTRDKLSDFIITLCVVFKLCNCCLVEISNSGLQHKSSQMIFLYAGRKVRCHTFLILNLFKDLRGVPSDPQTFTHVVLNGTRCFLYILLYTFSIVNWPNILSHLIKSIIYKYLYI